jgi:hypothetical protein
MKEQIRIPKLILTPSMIDSNNHWRLNQKDELIICTDCNFNLFYIEKQLGVIAEEFDYQISGYKEKRYFRLTEIGLNIYCAECGTWYENYSKWFYPEDKIIMTFDELGNVEQTEIDYCLSQYNQKHDFTPQFKCPEVNMLKDKLNEYVKKYPLKDKSKK